MPSYALSFRNSVTRCPIRYYIRRVRLSSTAHHLIGPLRAAGFTVEPAASDPTSTVVVEIPVHAFEGFEKGTADDSADDSAVSRVRRTGADVTMWEQLALAAFLQVGSLLFPRVL